MDFDGAEMYGILFRFGWDYDKMRKRNERYYHEGVTAGTAPIVSDEKQEAVHDLMPVGVIPLYPEFRQKKRSEKLF